MANTFDLSGVGEDMLLARASVTDGELIMLHNCCDTISIVVAEPRRGLGCPCVQDDLSKAIEPLGRIVARFDYSHGSLKWSMEAAYKRFGELAVLKSDFGDEDVEACPGCGCVPGDGTTAGCTDPDGCGYWDALGKQS